MARGAITSTAASVYKTSQASTTSNPTPPSAWKSGLNQSRMAAFTLESESLAAPSNVSISGRGTPSGSALTTEGGKGTTESPFSAAAQSAQYSVLGSRSVSTTSDAPASPAAMPASPSPVPRSITRFPRTSSGLHSTSSARATDPCQSVACADHRLVGLERHTCRR